jgi:hypothetical protein
MRLSTKVIDLGREHLGENVHEIGTIGKITIMEFKFVWTFMLICIQMVETIGVEAGGTTDDAVHLVTLGKKQFGEVRTVLTGNTTEQGNFPLPEFLRRWEVELQQRRRKFSHIEMGRSWYSLKRRNWVEVKSLLKEER